MLRIIGVMLSLVAGPVSASLMIDAYCTSKTCEDIRSESQRLKGLSVGVHELDATLTVSQKWTAAMKKVSPKTEEDGAKYLSEFMNSQEGRSDMQKMSDSAKAIERVVLSGIEKIPAYVCHQKYVVYGGTLHQAAKSCAEIGNQR